MSYEKQQLSDKWFRRRQWTIIEAAHIGAGADPYQGGSSTDNPHESFPRIEDPFLREAVEELYAQLKDAIGRKDLAVSERPRTGFIGNTRVEPGSFVTWAKGNGWDISHLEARLPSGNGIAHPVINGHPTPGRLAWTVNANEIGRALRPQYPQFNLIRLAKKVREEMERKHAAGEPGMTGRGGRIPSADTIKRHALTGI